MANLTKKLDEDSLTLSGDIDCTNDDPIPIVVTEVGRSLIHIPTDVLADIISKQKKNIQSFVPEIKCRLLEAGYQTFNEIGVKWNESVVENESRERRIERRSFEITMLLQWMKQNAFILDERRKKNKAVIPNQNVNSDEYLKLKRDNDRLLKQNRELGRQIQDLIRKTHGIEKKKTVAAHLSESKKLEKKPEVNDDKGIPFHLNRDHNKIQEENDDKRTKVEPCLIEELRNVEEKSGSDDKGIKVTASEPSTKINLAVKLSTFDDFDRNGKNGYDDNDSGSVSNSECGMSEIVVNPRILSESQRSSTNNGDGSNLPVSVPLPYKLAETYQILFGPVFDDEGNQLDIRGMFRKSSLKPREYGIEDVYTRKDGSFVVHCDSEENKRRFEIAAETLGLHSKQLTPQPYETRLHHICESVKKEDILEEIRQMTSIKPYKLVWCNYKKDRVGRLILVLSNLELYRILNQKKSINIRGLCDSDVDGIPIPVKCSNCGILGHRKFVCQHLNIPKEILELKSGCRDCAYRHYVKKGKQPQYRLNSTVHHNLKTDCPSWQFYSMKKWASFNGLPPVETAAATEKVNYVNKEKTLHVD